MSVKEIEDNLSKRAARAEANTVKMGKTAFRCTKFSPSWVVMHPKDTPIFKLELIDRIRAGVKKTDWKQLIQYTDSTEKEFEHILPASISSMQKKEVYSKETSERIYELAKLFGLGYEVFDSKEDFKKWLKTPSKSLGGKMPFDLLDSSFGFELVENEISRIQYNVYG
jgi:putative toxin-antitoxin system antitoxin component (TIGR02293 family)